jgi:hypothetical protein
MGRIALIPMLFAACACAAKEPPMSSNSLRHSLRMAAERANTLAASAARAALAARP